LGSSIQEDRGIDLTKLNVFLDAMDRKDMKGLGTGLAEEVVLKTPTAVKRQAARGAAGN
jgi:hypothetical protein